MEFSLFSFPLNPENEFTIALVSFESHRTYEDVASYLYEKRQKLQAINGIILRPTVHQQIETTKVIEEDYQQVINRYPSIPIYLLYSFDYEIILSPNLNNNSLEGLALPESLINTNFIGKLRQLEMENFITESNALFHSPPGTIYKTPSLEYSHYFLRAGNIQTRRHVLDAIFFWLIPLLKNTSAILTDSWSISSIAFNTARLLCRYDDKIHHGSFHVNMLSSYPNGQKNLDAETYASIEPLLHQNEKKILFLLSAIKTEKSYQALKNTFAGFELEEKIESVALYKLVNPNKLANESSISILCDLSNMKGVSFDSALDLSSNEKVIPIDEKVFFPLLVQESQINLTIDSYRNSKEFCHTYCNKDVFTIHRDALDLKKAFIRHHGIFIDINKMLEVESFTNKIKVAINCFNKAPNYIIHPPHEQGEKLASYIKVLIDTKFGTSVEIFSITDTLINNEERGIPEQLKKLSVSDMLLVIDDVSVTGSRLKSYQQNLRTSYKGQIHYFIGVARPENDTVWNKKVNELQLRTDSSGGKNPIHHIVTSIEKINLPDWDEKNCPWCNERNILYTLITEKKHDNRPFITSLRNRYSELQDSKKEGLANNVFFDYTQSKKPAFLGGSIFFDSQSVSEADLFIAIAASIHHLRIVGGPDVDNKTNIITLGILNPYYKILAIDAYLPAGARYNEAIIRACIIRACTRQELHAKTEENIGKQKKCLNDFISGVSLDKADKGFFLYDLYISLKAKKLPKPTEDKLINILAEKIGDQNS